MMAPPRILAIGAHPDDAEYKAGGSAVKWARQGHHVKLVSVTNGDIGHWKEAGGPLALPVLLAGALVAFLQALNQFGAPAILAIPAGFHTLTTKIWSLFQFPPKSELASAAAMPLLLLTVALLRLQSMALGRRGYAVLGGKYGAPRLVRLGWLRWAAVSFAMLVLAMPLFLPYAALINTVFSPVSSQLVTFETASLHNIRFTFWELSSTLPALKNTFILAVASATLGGVLEIGRAHV